MKRSNREDRNSYKRSPIRLPDLDFAKRWMLEFFGSRH